MTFSSDKGYLIILMMTPAHTIFQNKGKTIWLSVGKGEPHNSKKKEYKNVKRST